MPNSKYRFMIRLIVTPFIFFCFFLFLCLSFLFLFYFSLLCLLVVLLFSNPCERLGNSMTLLYTDVVSKKW
ncbi:hypothetical protein BDV23DRAFT_142773 [Aspergillus alliaceus]|uniref:Uncharacterized protein n=1 Tax=Petromyces alliaceus TaxID=209559 RepID=A0A5N7CQH5_PETAA|nr:hypothetical protein BDV23DRAFT_142773 [Aspergillus alliaceus]